MTVAKDELRTSPDQFDPEQRPLAIVLFNINTKKDARKYLFEKDMSTFKHKGSINKTSVGADSYLRMVARVSVIVLQRFNRASSLCGSSFRNFTASTSTLSTTRILLCRPGN